VRRPVTRFRHILKEEGFMCLRIKSMTADSSKPNWASIASNAVRSSQAISTMREMLASHRVKAPSKRNFCEFVIVEYYDTAEGLPLRFPDQENRCRSNSPPQSCHRFQLHITCNAAWNSIGVAARFAV
jgi:hypothetical protein